MRVTFLDHSGFLAELPSVTLLFDWWKGELPALRPGVPLLVFASHHHGDHFKPEIFQLNDGTREVRFLLGKDARLSPKNRETWGVSEDTAAKCLTLGGGRKVEPLPGVTVDTLTSTDEGVAFLVTADGRVIFHAGDLNWWHWEGEDVSWNLQMALHFKEFSEPLRGRHIDLAMLPLDSRLGESGFLGPKYFLELADIRRFLPMHQWGDFAFTAKFADRYPELAGRIVPVERPGQSWEFEDGTTAGQRP